MKAFTKLTANVLPLNRANVDTDQIIPKQFLKSIGRTGFGDFLFDAWRFHDEGEIGMTPNERQINHSFVLNDPRYQDVGILLAGDNFGCGSSREHAVWALEEYGIRCVIATSFADIFYNNCFKNGVLPIVLDRKNIEILFDAATKADALELVVDLRAQTITGLGSPLSFDIDKHRKASLLEGLDDIGASLEMADQIIAFERRHKENNPWLFNKEPRSG